jgi:hypothetical protein
MTVENFVASSRPMTVESCVAPTRSMTVDNLVAAGTYLWGVGAGVVVVCVCVCVCGGGSHMDPEIRSRVCCVYNKWRSPVALSRTLAVKPPSMFGSVIGTREWPVAECTLKTGHYRPGV